MGFLSRLCPLLLLLIAPALPAQQPTLATTVPLILPSGLAYDAAGNLYFAETGNHVVRRVTPAGVLTTVAGTGVQGYAGDGGTATAALLDSPLAVAVDAAGDLFLADSHNHCIRRVDAATGMITSLTAQVDLPSALAIDAAANLFVADERTHRIVRIDHASGAVTTVAGNGTQGFAGDGGLATQASIDSPTGLALDAAGDLFLADTHNQRVRRVDAVTGVITTVAGSGQPGFAGDAGAAVGARLDLPRGLVLDAAGNLFVVDSRNQRVRRVDAATGQITTIAGEGTQAYAGDGGPAVAASLDTPRAVTLSPTGLPTISDTGDARVRQVDGNALIHTIAGLGTSTPGTLVLSGPSVTLYGTGTVTATLESSAATGTVTFFDAVASSMQTLIAAPLSSNVATLPTGTLAAGTYSFSATYGGDALHSAAQSLALAVRIAPAPVVAQPVAVTVLYGVPIPALTGSLTGVLARDASTVSLVLTSAATGQARAAVYPIVASLAGAAAGNYALTQGAAAVTITQAPATIALSNALAVHVASTTSGTPTGVATLYDAGAMVASAPLSATGDASFAGTSLSNGTHTLTVGYGGDVDFLAASSNAVVATIGAGPAADFTLAATGQTSVTVVGGSPAQFSFAVTPVNGALASPIVLSASGLPVGATASFNPAYLPPANTPAAFILTIQTVKTASLERRSLLILAGLLPVCLWVRKRRRLVTLTGLMMLTLGCGDRVNTVSTTKAGATYNVTVTGTATSAGGATLLHTTVVALAVQ